MWWWVKAITGLVTTFPTSKRFMITRAKRKQPRKLAMILPIMGLLEQKSWRGTTFTSTHWRTIENSQDITNFRRMSYRSVIRLGRLRREEISSLTTHRGSITLRLMQRSPPFKELLMMMDVKINIYVSNRYAEWPHLWWLTHIHMVWVEHDCLPSRSSWCLEFWLDLSKIVNVIYQMYIKMIDYKYLFIL